MLISTNSRKKGDEMPDYLRLEAFRTTPLVKQPFRSTVTTVRGRCDLSDGKIHTDSKSKIITVLIYMNETWEQAGGRLRLLRSATDLNDIIVEVPPVAGTLLAFKRSHNSWHGHESFSGEPRVIQFNWLTSQGNRQIAMLRHHTSASFKRVLQMILPNR